MTKLRTALRLAGKVRDGDDEGFTLMEVLVASTIFAIFMTGVMFAIISMLTTTQKSQSLQDGAANLENVFQKLDHQVRYADAIEPPSATSVTGPYYVEWRSQSNATTPQTCTELKYDASTHFLSERSWQPSATPVTATAWITLAPNVFNTTSPFVFTASGPAPAPSTIVFAHQQLMVTLNDQPSGTGTATSEKSSISAAFTALNSDSTTGTVCQEVAHS